MSTNTWSTDISGYIVGNPTTEREGFIDRQRPGAPSVVFNPGTNTHFYTVPSPGGTWGSTASDISNNYTKGYIEVYEELNEDGGELIGGYEDGSGALVGDASGDKFAIFTSLAYNTNDDILYLAGSSTYGPEGYAAGYIKVWQYDIGTTTWSLIGGQLDSSGGLIGDVSNNNLGHTLDMVYDASQQFLFVAGGAPYDSYEFNNDYYKGYVNVYKYDTNTTNWTQIGGKIDISGGIRGDVSNNRLGNSVSMTIDTNTNSLLLAAAAPGGLTGDFDSNDYQRGYINVYKYDIFNETWSIIGGYEDSSGSLIGDVSNNRLGDATSSISIDFESATNSIYLSGGVVGYTESDSEFDRGTVKVWEYLTDNSWNVIADQTTSGFVGNNDSSSFGNSTSIFNNNGALLLAVGEPGYSPIEDYEYKGRIHNFYYNFGSTTWNATQDEFSNLLISDISNIYLGTHVSLALNSNNLDVKLLGTSGPFTEISGDYFVRHMYYISNTQLCFVKGTKILTDKGEINIEHLTRNHTINNNKIHSIPKSIFKGKKLIVIKKDAFGLNHPYVDTIITPQHRVYEKEENPHTTRILNLVNNETILEIDANKEVIYSVVLDNKHDYMYANGLKVETTPLKDVPHFKPKK